jgi:hypothetical protein
MRIIFEIRMRVILRSKMMVILIFLKKQNEGHSIRMWVIFEIRMRVILE